ncbi:MAG: hypothetical protein ACXVXP_00240 [Mycobacteriaceae bacterium]
MTLVDIIAEHFKECSSDHCAACDCGWDLPEFDSGLLAHAEHLAAVITEWQAGA